MLRTDHFEIVYREDQKALAKRYALAAERARELLMPLFKEGPDSTVIYIGDETDSANGAASMLPYPTIVVYPVVPAPLDSIDDYGDWPFELMVHEYTHHILNMYPRHGIYVPLSYIFGDVIRPNLLLPQWYLEGLAVNNETRLSDHGRLRADRTEADARALVLDERLSGETLSKINEQELLTLALWQSTVLVWRVVVGQCAEHLHGLCHPAMESRLLTAFALLAQWPHGRSNA